jgi:hypothetical protein
MSTEISEPTTPEPVTPEPEQKQTPTFKNFPLETRDFKFNGESYSFNFLVIDRAEKWLGVNDYEHKTILRSNGNRKGLVLPLKGLSYEQWSEIEFEHIRPDIPDNIDSLEQSAQDAYKKKVDEALQARTVKVMEVSTGKSIPGNTIEEKLHFLQSLGMGEAEALHDKVVDYYSACDPGDQVPIYRALTKQVKPEEQIVFQSFDDWLSLSYAGMPLQWQHPWEDFLIEFPLKKITQEEYDDIFKEYAPPNPPERPGKNPVTGKLDPKTPLRNFSDRNYRNRTREVAVTRLVALLDLLLPFQIPGNNEKDKAKWLGSRLLGDVTALEQFLNLELRNYKARFDFFTAS